MESFSFNDIDYIIEAIGTESLKRKFDGGILGGIFFENQRGEFGSSRTGWFATIGEAAQAAWDRELVAYEAAARKVKAYEAACNPATNVTIDLVFKKATDHLLLKIRDKDPGCVH